MEDGKSGFLTDYVYGNDIGIRQHKYDGAKTIEAILQAFNDAETGDRIITINAAADGKNIGDPQRTHSAWGILLVAQKIQPDGGTGGGGDE